VQTTSYSEWTQTLVRSSSLAFLYSCLTRVSLVWDLH